MGRGAWWAHKETNMTEWLTLSHFLPIHPSQFPSIYLLPFINTHFHFLYVFSWLDSSFLFSAESLSECTTVYLSISLFRTCWLFPVFRNYEQAPINICVYVFLYCFNWRKIVLKCCVGFCCTTSISHKDTYILSLLSLPPLHPLMSQSARLDSLCYIATSQQLSILHMRVYKWQCYFFNSFHPLLPTRCPQVHPLHVHINSVQFSYSAMPDSLQCYGTQHARPPCPSLTPRVYSNSCPLSRWCHLTISSSVVPFPPAFNLSQNQGLFKWVSSLHQVAKVLEIQLQHQSFQWIFRTDFL